MISLNLLPQGVRATLESFSKNTEFTERLQEMGLTPGREFVVVRRAPFGGPIELSFGNIRLAIRSKDSREILVSPLA